MPFQLTGIDKVQATYAHVYLSPHLDDAALSCGGAIARFAALGQPVLVVNVCSGGPPRGGPFSPFATFQHERWGLAADEAVALRLAEDAVALETLGADSLGLGLLDAIYRMPAAYVDDETLFGPVAPDDTLVAAVAPLLAELAARLPGAIFYAPLAVGGHVDHQAVYEVAVALAASGVTVAYYEDFPYAAQGGSVERRLGELGGMERFAPAVVEIGEQIERKTAAIGAYASQLGTLFGGYDEMAEAVAAYARAVAPAGAEFGERVWMKL